MEGGDSLGGDCFELLIRGSAFSPFGTHGSEGDISSAAVGPKRGEWRWRELNPRPRNSSCGFLHV